MIAIIKLINFNAGYPLVMHTTSCNDIYTILILLITKIIGSKYVL